MSSALPSPQAQLLAAALIDDLEAARGAHEQGADPWMWENAPERMPVVAAARAGSRRCFAFFLGPDFDVESCQANLRLASESAAQEGHLECFLLAMRGLGEKTIPDALFYRVADSANADFVLALRRLHLLRPAPFKDLGAIERAHRPLRGLSNQALERVFSGKSSFFEEVGEPMSLAFDAGLPFPFESAFLRHSADIGNFDAVELGLRAGAAPGSFLGRYAFLRAVESKSVSCVSAFLAHGLDLSKLPLEAKALRQFIPEIAQAYFDARSLRANIKVKASAPQARPARRARI